MQSSKIVSIQVGMPKSYGVLGATDPMDQPWMSGFVKLPVIGQVSVGPLGLAGDGQADLKNHGGIDKAILAYSAEHYPAWRAELEMDAQAEKLSFGGFGENLTVGELTEADFCIGDMWEAGDVLLQVSQPRQPCWKLARRWRRKDLPKRVVQTGRSGWYFRVMAAGVLQAGLALECVERIHPQWSVARASQVMYDKPAHPADVAALRAMSVLAEGWKSSLPA